MMSKPASAHKPTPAPTAARQQLPILDMPQDQDHQDHGDGGGDSLVTTLSWTDLHAKPPPRQTAAASSVPAAPEIRIRAPTPDGNASSGDTSEGDECHSHRNNIAVLDGDSDNACAALALRRNCIAASPAETTRHSQPSAHPETASKPWTDELIKKTINMESAFELSSSSSAASSPSSSCYSSLCGDDDENQPADNARATEEQSEGTNDRSRGEVRDEGEDEMGASRPRASSEWERTTVMRSPNPSQSGLAKKNLN
jgi:hypothetical protein